MSFHQLWWLCHHTRLEKWWKFMLKGFPCQRKWAKNFGWRGKRVKRLIDLCPRKIVFSIKNIIKHSSYYIFVLTLDFPNYEAKEELIPATTYESWKLIFLKWYLNHNNQSRWSLPITTYFLNFWSDGLFFTNQLCGKYANQSSYDV